MPKPKRKSTESPGTTSKDAAGGVKPEERDILTVDQASDYLAVARSTLYKLIQRGLVPHMKIGGAVRFSRRMLLEWVETESKKSIGAKEPKKE